jgi:hypothetical protein
MSTKKKIDSNKNVKGTNKIIHADPNIGWKCPVCGRGNSPKQLTCPCICEPKTVPWPQPDVPFEWPFTRNPEEPPYTIDPRTVPYILYYEVLSDTPYDTFWPKGGPRG